MKRIVAIALVAASLTITGLVASPAVAAGGDPVIGLQVRTDRSCEFKATGSWRSVPGAYRESMRFSYWSGGGYTTRSLQQSYVQASRGRVVKYQAATSSLTSYTWRITFTVHDSSDVVLGSETVEANYLCAP